MFVGMWMTKEVVTTEPSKTLDSAAQLMAARHIRRLPVLETSNYDSKLVGILSSTDVLRAMSANAKSSGVGASEQITVRDVMTPYPVTITADAPVEAAAALMRDRKIGALPVVRGDSIVGLITESDVFRAFTQLFDLSAAGARITFDISQGEDVLPFIAAEAHKHGLRVSSFVSLHTLELPMCVVHVTGSAVDALLEDVWKSHHRVASVIRSSKN